MLVDLKNDGPSRERLYRCNPLPGTTVARRLCEAYKVPGHTNIHVEKKSCIIKMLYQWQ
jgi:hypothetical protein